MEVAHPQSDSSSTWFLVEVEFVNAGFWGEGKTGVVGEKPLEAKERTDNKLHPHMALTLGFEPGPHWWEARVLTTAPSLAPLSEITVSIFSIWGYHANHSKWQACLQARALPTKILPITMTETRFYEPARLSTPPKPLFSLKLLDANLVEVIVI